jgi:L-fuculose-phosphate aldolase
MTDNNHADLRQGIVDTCREMNRNGLNQGTSGNLSHRIPNGMLITPTSLPYDRMRGRARGRRTSPFCPMLPSSSGYFHRSHLKLPSDLPA